MRVFFSVLGIVGVFLFLFFFTPLFMPPSQMIEGPVQGKDNPEGGFGGAEPWRSEPIDDMSLPPELKTQVKQRIQEEAEKGYYTVTEKEDGDFQTFEQYQNEIHSSRPRLLQSIEEMQERYDLMIKPASLEKTPFEKFRFIGASPEVLNMNGQVSFINRVFTTPEGGVVELKEFDYRVAGTGGGVTVKELINAEVNDYPAIFSVAKNGSGKAMSMMTWATENKSYTVTMEGNVRENGSVEQFFALARSIKDEPNPRWQSGASTQMNSSPIPGVAFPSPQNRYPLR